MTQDGIIMGDFNADCSYVCQSCFDELGLWTNKETFKVIVPHSFDTTTTSSDCAYDRYTRQYRKLLFHIHPSPPNLSCWFETIKIHKKTTCDNVMFLYLPTCLPIYLFFLLHFLPPPSLSVSCASFLFLLFLFLCYSAT